MRMGTWGGTFGVVVLVLALALGVLEPPVVLADRNGPAARNTPTDQLTTMSFDLGDGRQQVVAVDPKTHVMAVYHLEKNTGKIMLKSVRNITFDLMMDEYETGDPTPQRIQALAQPR